MTIRVRYVNTMKQLMESPSLRIFKSGVNLSIMDTYSISSWIIMWFGPPILYLMRWIFKSEIVERFANQLTYNHKLERVLKYASYESNPFEICVELCKFVYLDPIEEYVDKINHINTNICIIGDSSDVFADRDMRIVIVKYKTSDDTCDLIFTIKGTTPASTKIGPQTFH